MKYIITKTSVFQPYFGMGEYDGTQHCRDLYTLFDLSCVEIAEPLFDTIYPLLPAGYEEVTADEALYGSLFFSEVRPTVKIMNPETMMAETEGMDEFKVEIEFTQEMQDNVRNFMFKFAKEIIETEYNFRFHRIRNTTELEQASWEIQKHEAREWLTYGDTDPDHVTPFLDYLCQERAVEKTWLANKILEKAEEFADKLSTTLVEYQTLIKKFEDALTIWDMNLLYERYLGIMVPAKQAELMGIADETGLRFIVDDEWNVVLNENGNKMIDQNNFRFGNKLNF